MSGAGDSDTPSVSTSRKVRPPIGKSAGASSALMTASTSAGSLVGKRPNDRRPCSRGRAGKVDLDVPGLLLGAGRLSRVRERKVAVAGLSRVMTLAGASARGSGAVARERRFAGALPTSS